MRVIVCHNFYRLPGGEDQVFADEVKLLRDYGHDVEVFTVDNKVVGKHIASVATAAGAVWSSQSYAKLRDLTRRVQAQVVHFHNTFPLISPAAYYAARAEGAAVVQTLHNYRLICPAATLFRDGHVCEECLKRRSPWTGVRHGCYRGSRPATAALATMLVVHGCGGTWNRAVDAFIALTEFSRTKFIEGGLPGERIVVKPNFLHTDPGIGAGTGGYVAYVGRLTSEKGIQTLLSAWGRGDLPIGMSLRIYGDGPLAPMVRRAAEGDRSITWLGHCPATTVIDALGGAASLVVPSLWYEGQPRSIIESLARGTPVIASRCGALPETIIDDVSGVVFQPGHAADLARQLGRVLEDASLRARLRSGARAEFDRRFTAARNIGMLEDVYNSAIRRRAVATTAPSHSFVSIGLPNVMRARTRRAPDSGLPVATQSDEPLRVVMVHNYYRFPGGEDAVFDDEQRLLRERGHAVTLFTRDNKLVRRMDSLTTAAAAVWNGRTYAALRRLVRSHRADVVHFHNTFPLISPAAYYAARAEGAAVVQTLHNYRLICPAATLFRDGHVCEDCLKHRMNWPAVAHGCYRKSRAATAATATVLNVHRLAGTWATGVDQFIALSDFSRGKLIEGGLPPKRIVVKPNFVHPDPGPGTGGGGYAIYVGALVPGKGIETLLSAWRCGLRIPLYVVGQGPMASAICAAATAGRLPIRLLGQKPHDTIYNLLGRADCLIFPSEWYENLPKTIIESLCRGTPVITSNLGPMASLVQHGLTGLHFRPGDGRDLAARIDEFFAEGSLHQQYRRRARVAFEQTYTAEANYRQLLSIYRAAVVTSRLSYAGSACDSEELNEDALRTLSPIASQSGS